MSQLIGIRRETKSRWERRVPLTPDTIRHLIHEKDLHIKVQASPRRIFPDNEFIRAGADVANDLSDAGVIFGVKEIPSELLQPGTTYVYFAHVIKGQPYNMGMLRRLMELGCTLIDYEKIRDAEDRRLIFFGRFAGLAGAIDSLWTLGQRLTWEGIKTPFADLRPAHEYASLDEAKAAIHAAGELIASDGLPEQLRPLAIGVAGYGNVAIGAQEILNELPLRDIEPEQLTELARSSTPSGRRIWRVTFREEHMVEPRDPDRTFVLQDYYDNPEHYRSSFAAYLPYLTGLINCNYWDERYPRLVRISDVRRLFENETQPRLRVLGDVGCDIDGSIQCTTEVTEPGNPIYVYDPRTQQTAFGVEGRGPVVLAVDILPAELPRDASEEFSSALAPLVPAIAAADYSSSFEDLDLPDEIKRAVIVHRGALTPDYRYLEHHLKSE